MKITIRMKTQQDIQSTFNRMSIALITDNYFPNKFNMKCTLTLTLNNHQTRNGNIKTRFLNQNCKTKLKRQI